MAPSHLLSKLTKWLRRGEVHDTAYSVASDPLAGALSVDRTRVAAAVARVAKNDDIEILQESGRLAPIVAGILRDVGSSIAVGITTHELSNRLVEQCGPHRLLPAMLGYNGFPAPAAISVNEEVVHGIPSSKILCESDLVKMEFSVVSDIAFASQSWTFPVGVPSDRDRLLLVTGPAALRAAISTVGDGRRLGDVGAAIQETVQAAGLSVIRDFVGYGMGKLRIQEPKVSGFGTRGRGARLQPGWILNIHVILKHGAFPVDISENGWTAISRDRERAALFTCMVEVTRSGHQVLTPLLDE